MAKMSRLQLKGIVKECLLEILLEGLDSKKGVLGSTPKITESRSQRRTERAPRPALDSIQINKQIEQKVSSLTSDPILGEIFAETARSGMAQSTESSSGKISHSDQIMQSGDQAAKFAASADPTELFSESANNWADLAFSSK